MRFDPRLAMMSLLFVAAGGNGIHHRFTTQELRQFFGTESLTEIPNYQVTSARRHSLEKRSIIPNSDLFYQINIDGTNLTLHLENNRRLLSPYFELKPDGLDVNISAALDCLYQGKIVAGSGRVAVSSCGKQGLTGMIDLESGRYEIYPLPARFQENPDDGHLHVVVPKNETGTFCGVHELTTTQKLTAFTSEVQRNRRETNPEKLFIETAVFADYMLYRTLVGKTLISDHDAFVKYVLAIVNTVQLIYNEPSLGRPVEIVLVRLEILQNENLPFYSEEVDKYLWDFCKWQSGLNPGSDLSNPSHWDHAIILTGFDLRSGSMRSVTGYAPVGGMCNPMYSCTINEGNHFGAAFVIAHEMGHSLTMQHDGQAGVSGNACDAQHFLMSPSTGRGKTTWSTCSRTYLDLFLASPQSTCLKDVPPGREGAINFDPGNLPGQLYTPDEQCKMLYGMEFHRYTMQPDADVCEILICANSTVYITGHPALPGTFCGPGNWCAGGACVPWGLGGPVPVDGGWSAWPSTSDCVASCISPGTGIRVFERTCTNPAQANGGKTCEGKSKRFRKCDQSILCLSQPKLSVADYSNQQCQSTKSIQNDFTLTGSGRQRQNDPTGGCLVWCDTYQGGYKTWGMQFPDGTDCSSATGRAFCVEGQCKAFGCDGWTLDESNPINCVEGQTTQVSIPDSSTTILSPATAQIFSKKSVTLASREPMFQNDTSVFVTINASWSPWRNAGPCLSSCLQESTGLQKVGRKCMDSNGICNGRNITVSKCVNTCPKINYTAEMYVNKICSALQTIDRSLTGTGKQLPFSADDLRQSCKLWCFKGDTLRSWPEMNFPDGTLCASHGPTKSYCVKGSCTEFRCDNLPTDQTDVPKCERLSNLKLVNPSKKPAAFAKLSVMDVPQTGLIPVNISLLEQSNFQWTVISSACSRSCDGGTRKNHIRCTQLNVTLKGSLKVNQSMCPADSRPSIPSEEPCNIIPCPRWNPSDWGVCSATCGVGVQARLVQCVYDSPSVGPIKVETILSDSHCDRSVKPASFQECSSKSCNKSFIMIMDDHGLSLEHLSKSICCFSADFDQRDFCSNPSQVTTCVQMDGTSGESYYTPVLVNAPGLILSTSS